MFFVAHLAGRSFVRHPSLPVLLLGSGSLAFGLVSLISALAIHYGNHNVGVTVYNTGMLLSGLCHALGAALIGTTTDHLSNRRVRLLMKGAFAVVLTLVGLTTFLSLQGEMPLFFIQGEGPTLIRQAVLGSAVAVFALAGLIHLIRSYQTPRLFSRLYGAGLAIIATGLLGVLPINQVGSPLNWVGRVAQYVGGIYFLVAAVAEYRESGRWQLSLHEALRKSEERFQLAVVAAGLGEFHYYFEDGRLCLSPSLVEIYGLEQSQAEYRGETVQNIVHPEDLKDLVAKFGSIIAQQTPPDFSMEFRIIRADGQQRWIYMRGQVLFGNNAPRAIYGIGMDITDRKIAEQVLRHSKEDLEREVQQRTSELRQRADQLARLTSELTLAEQRERQRMAQVLHDHLQQVLVSTKFHVHGLQKRLSDPGSQNLAQRALEMVEESIQISRSLTVELAPPVLHKDGLVAGLRWLCEDMLARHGLAVEFRSDLNAIIKREDMRVLLFQSVREMLLNIVKHAGVNEARVEVAMDESQRLRVTVSDSGCGFDPKAQAANAAGCDGGFGLFSIRERVSLLGGEMTVASAPGAGSTFCLAVPMSGEVCFTPSDHKDSQQPSAA